MSLFTVFGVLSEQRLQVWCCTLLSFWNSSQLWRFHSLPSLCILNCVMFAFSNQRWNQMKSHFTRNYLILLSSHFLFEKLLNSCIAYFKSLLPNRIKSVQSSIPHVSILLKRIWVNGSRGGAIEMYWCWGFSNCCCWSEVVVLVRIHIELGERSEAVLK